MKRQATKLWRTEHSVEEMARKLTKLEELRSDYSRSSPAGYLEVRVATCEQRQAGFEEGFRELQMQLDDLHNAARPDQQNQLVDEDRQCSELGASSVDDALHAAERSMAQVDKRISAQVDEVAAGLASLRIKVDGQLQRTSALAARIETAHEPAMAAFREELREARTQDRRDLDSSLAAVRGAMQELSSAQDEVAEDFR